MKIKLKNPNKMSRYLAWRLGRVIQQEEINDCFEYIREFAEYINEERNGDTLIRERASIELEIDDDDYEVWVIFDSVIENDEKMMLVDFDYSYESEICGFSFH